MSERWRAALIKLGLVWLALLAMLWRDVAHMVSIWWNVSTYSHCLFILPIAAWLVWLRRHEVAALAPGSWLPGIALVVLASLVWMIGDAGGVALLRHAAVILMLQASALALLGPTVGRALLFPLFYLVFLIPFGDEFVAPMQSVTARLTMVFLGVAGIPARLDGVFITTPIGLFEVAEACAGVKFLIAMVAYGALVANLCFVSWRRRAAFMGLAVVVPVVANGLRAFATIAYSEWSGSVRFAESFDHIIFGWVFFALVMALVLAMGWKFFDRRHDEPWLGKWAKNAHSPGFAPHWRVAGLALLAAAMPIVWGAATAARGIEPMPHQLALPEVPGWRRVAIVQREPWAPRFDHADHRLFGQYADAQGRRVDLAIAIFASQSQGRELVGYKQGAFDPESRWSWTSDAHPFPHGKAVWIVAPGVKRQVVSFHHLGGVTTGDARAVKWQTMRARLGGGDRAATALLLSAEGDGRAAIEAFARSLGDPGVVANRLVAQARGG